SSVATAKKAYNLPPALVRRVKKILGAKTETEAIVRCMSEVAFMDDVDRAVNLAVFRITVLAALLLAPDLHDAPRWAALPAGLRTSPSGLFGALVGLP